MPAGGSAVPRSAQPPGTDWKDSYFSLDVRYQQLRKLLNTKEEELKLLKVAQRKSKPTSTSNTGRLLNSLSSENPEARPTSAPGRPSKIGVTRNGAVKTHVEEENVLADSANYPRTASTTSVAELAPMLGPAAKLPDPAMIWGSESNVNNYVIASALYHANEELQSKLNESSTMIQALQRELSSSRSLCANFQARIEDLANQIHQLVRERDLASQKLATSQQSVTNLQRTLQDHIGEEQKLRFSLESQIADLRSRLIVGADANDLLNKDVRSLISDTKVKDQQVMSLQSKLALAESALSSQRNTNENLLVELRGLNQQLVEERKRLLVAVRELELLQFSKDKIASLEAQLRQMTEERARMEREQATLLAEYARSTEAALGLARGEVQADLADAQRAAQHWEGLAQLLYKDIADRTRSHQRCREACEAAQTQRDALSVELRQTNDALRLCNAKLDVVWPHHHADTEGLSAEAIVETFKPRAAAALGLLRGQLEGARRVPVFSSVATPPRRGGAASEMEKELPPDPTTAVDRIHELQEANALLFAEVEQLQLANEMHLARIETITGRHDQERQHITDAKKEVESREAAGRVLLARQLDRVQFLESQVRSLRGYHVSPSTTIETIPTSETVLELFLGQMVAAEVPEGVPVPEHFSQMFCSVDFLLHETVTTPTVHGFNGFFDTTISFQIAMDALLLYYLQTRQLLVQLHRIRSDNELSPLLGAQGGEGQRGHSGKEDGVDSSHSIAARSDSDGLKMVEQLFETVAEGYTSLVELVAQEESLHAARPMLKGHIKLIRFDGKHVASVEFLLTARTPFSEGFKELVKATLPSTGGGASRPQILPASNRLLASSEAASPASTPAMNRFTRSYDSTTQDSSDLSPSVGKDEATTPFPRRGGSMQLIPASPGASAMLARSLPSSSTSLSGSTERRSLPPREQRTPFRQATKDPIRFRPQQRSFPGTATTAAASTASAGVAASFGGAGGFVHLPSPLLASLRVVAFAVDVGRVELPVESTPPIPRLSCHYLIPSMGRTPPPTAGETIPTETNPPQGRKEGMLTEAAEGVVVRLAAPALPQYTVVYARPGGHPAGEVFPITSLAQLARLAREPLTLVFVDEDAVGDESRRDANEQSGKKGKSGGERGVWGVALCECAAALARPGSTQTYTLPLWRPGEAGRTMRKGAVVRVRVTAFASEAATEAEGIAATAPVGGTLASASGDTFERRETGMTSGPSRPRWAPAAGDGGKRQPPMEAMGGSAATPGLRPPSSLQERRGLLDFETDHQQWVSPFSITATGGSQRDSANVVNVGTPPSLEEELMRLEYEKHRQKG